jgi:hypothetical protein
MDPELTSKTNPTNESRSESNSASPPWLTMLLGLLAVGISGLVTFDRLDSGWIPHDEGQLGQAATRILDGQLPHRDFDDMYTGGLSYLNAFSMQSFGENSLSMRWMLFAWFLPFAAACFWIFKQFANATVAAVLTVLACVWSVPMYPAPMPSWYLLFLATGALAALLRTTQTNSRIWIFLAGLLMGAAVLFKINGIFTLAAGLLFLLDRSQRMTLAGTTASKTTTGINRLPMSWIVIGLLAMAGSLAFAFVNKFDYLMQSIHFVAPFLTIIGFAILQEYRWRGDWSQRLPLVMKDVIALLLGFAIPLAGLFAYFASQDALEPLLEGMFVAPTKRIEGASSPFPALGTMLLSVPLALLLFPSLWLQAAKLRGLDERKLDNTICLIVVVAGILLLAFRESSAAFLLSAFSIRHIGPFLTLGCLYLLWRNEKQFDGEKLQGFYLATVIAFFASLIQYPYAAMIYFFYAAPLFVIAGVVATRMQPWIPKRSLVAAAVVLVLFTIVRFHSVEPVTSLSPTFHEPVADTIESGRCPLVIRDSQARIFNQLIDAIESRTDAGDVIHAMPDAPEVAYISNRIPFGRTMYEFFADPASQTPDGLRKGLQEADAKLLVIKENPSFSKPVTSELLDILTQDYQLVEQIYWQAGNKENPVYSIYQKRN